MEIIFTQKDISKVAKHILDNCDSKVVLFYGKMGVGKTTLIKELSRLLGVREMASSPTFSIVNEYESSHGPLYHFDFYRIETPQEALDLGVEDYLYSGDYVFMEWPERIAELLPEDAAKVSIEKNADESRTLRMEMGNNRHKKLFKP